MSVPVGKPDDPPAGAPPTPTQIQGIKIEGLAQPGSGVISTQGITFTVIPSPQPQQGQRFMIPKVSPQQQFAGINPLTIKPVGANPGTPGATVNTVGNLTVKSVGANQNIPNTLQGVNVSVKPASQGTPTATVASFFWQSD